MKIDHGDMKQSLISEFAVILNTTAEYLFCGEKNKYGLNTESYEVLNMFKKMDEKTKEIILMQMRFWAK